MQTSTHNDLPLWLIPLFPVFFVALWCLICAAIGWLSGWHALAERFRATSEPYGDVHSAGPFFYSVYFRSWAHYNSVVRLSEAQDALYLSVMFLFRIGHPPLRVPWEEIQFRRTEIFFQRYIVLTLGREEQIPMRIPERMAGNLGILKRL